MHEGFDCLDYKITKQKEGIVMAKIIAPPQSKLSLPTGTKAAPTIKQVRPMGSSVLVEMLNPDEALGTTLFVREDAKTGQPPQGYVLALGPSLKSDDCGIKPGDRVLLQGTFVPVPEFDSSSRKRGIVE